MYIHIETGICVFMSIVLKLKKKLTSVSIFKSKHDSAQKKKPRLIASKHVH